MYPMYLSNLHGANKNIFSCLVLSANDKLRAYLEERYLSTIINRGFNPDVLGGNQSKIPATKFPGPISTNVPNPISVNSGLTL